jgi:Zn-finger nucleic acid-binding protein
MGDSVMCLGCGGVVDEGTGVPDGAMACTCPPPSVEVAAILCPSCGGRLRVGARACPFCGSTLATRRCAHCTAWNLAEAQHCQKCGRRIDDDEGRGPIELSSKPCPRCGQLLAARQYGDLDVDECDGCGGLLVTPRMMDRIVAARDTPADLRLALPKRPSVAEQRVTYLRCPGCGTSMNRRNFGRISGVLVDVCRDHGVWFDSGELSEVLGFIEAGGLARARDREIEEREAAKRAARSKELSASGLETATLTPGRSFGAPVSTHSGLDLASVFVLALSKLWE